jgi:hypothetical protein
MGIRKNVNLTILMVSYGIFYFNLVDNIVTPAFLVSQVSALLLLSQQEERHILEENTIAAQEYRIAILQKQLMQVRGEVDRN